MKRPWGLGRVPGAYRQRLQAVLDLYAQPYAVRFPVVCFEQRPCLLRGDVVEGLAPPPGRPAQQPYAYPTHGACGVLAAVEPLTGRRLYQVREQRPQREFTQFLPPLAARYPHAEQMRLVLDKLNTHALRTFSDGLPAAQARQLADRFDFCSTPKGGSGLHLIELDFSALSRQCLKRRLPTQAQLAYPVSCWSRQRHEQGLKLDGQFPVEQARQALNSQYQKGNRANKKYQKTSSTAY